METKDLNVVFNGVYGSHLYGLSTPSSDLDYKGVYAPEVKDLVFNTYKDSIDRQTPEVDETFYAVTKFLKILGKCDTVSMDMLFTPEHFTLETSPLWEEFREYRQDVFCKRARGLIGYIRTQATKYGHKVQRFDEMTEFLSLINKSGYENQLIANTTLVDIVKTNCWKYIKFTPAKGDVRECIDICGSKYQTDAQVWYMKQGLTTKVAQYGERTKKGSLQHGDWKSLSHSLRVLIQMEEWIETRELVFPLVRADEILAVKTGQIAQSKVIGMIDEGYDRVMEMLDKSDLPEYNDMSRMQDAVMNYYFG